MVFEVWAGERWKRKEDVPAGVPGRGFAVRKTLAITCSCCGWLKGCAHVGLRWG